LHKRAKNVTGKSEQNVDTEKTDLQKESSTVLSLVVGFHKGEEPPSREHLDESDCRHVLYWGMDWICPNNNTMI
jgi:hypothetical protein